MRKIKRRTDKQASYQVKLAAFTGPLDLLLHLIERAEIDIYNIPIVEITDQFLAYLQTMELFDLHIAADFLLMAATLMQIKARMLLPRPLVETEVETTEEEDPRLELVERLLEYKKRRKWPPPSRTGSGSPPVLPTDGWLFPRSGSCRHC